LRLIPKRTTKKNLTAATNVIPIARHPKFQPSKEREYTDEELCAFAEGIAKYGRFYFADDEDQRAANDGGGGWPTTAS